MRDTELKVVRDRIERLEGALHPKLRDYFFAALSILGGGTASEYDLLLNPSARNRSLEELCELRATEKSLSSSLPSISSSVLPATMPLRSSALVNVAASASSESILSLCSGKK